MLKMLHSSDSGPPSGPGDDPLSIRFDAQTGTYETDYRSSARSPSRAVISTVALATETDPTDLPPLFDALDTEALDALFGGDGPGRDGATAELSFEYAGQTVTVGGDGVLEVAPADQPEAEGDADSSA